MLPDFRDKVKVREAIKKLGAALNNIGTTKRAGV
jgi:hypothetical protein